MQLLQQIFFILISGVSIFFFAKKVMEIRRNIFLGRKEDLTDNPGGRWKNMALLAMGQQKMFKRPIAAVLHLFVYLGFIIINIEILEIILDGISGQHRMFAPMLGSVYAVLIGCFEILAVLVLLGCAVFLYRRNVKKVPRLAQAELDGWPKNDANLILITEIVLMTLLLAMNTADQVLQSRGVEHYTVTDSFWISGMFTGLFAGLSDCTLVAIERGGWWLHIVGVFAFMNYLPYSKHFHVIIAFPNAYYMRLKKQGEVRNMAEIQKEVLYMMEPDKAPADAAPPAEPQRFGAKDVMDLSWKNLMDSYACTECGRCTAVCPANQTGKKLSPRKIMMDTRDRLEEVGANINKNKEFVDDGKTLVHDYISVEELRACTTCQACVEACPVSIDPLNIIYELRRYLIMEESNSPEEWTLMFGNIENNMAPWKFSPDERDRWVSEMTEA